MYLLLGKGQRGRNADHYYLEAEPGRRRGAGRSVEHGVLPVASQAPRAQSAAPASGSGAAVVSCLQLLRTGSPPTPASLSVKC